MDPKSKSQLTHSRASAVCDYCGKAINRHNLKRHTLDHHKGQPVKERIVGVLSVSSFFQSLNNTRNNNTEQPEDLPDTEIDKESDAEMESELIVEKEECTLNDLKDHITKNHEEVMSEITRIKSKCGSCDEGKTNEPNLKKHKENDHYILEKAKTFKDCIGACPEFEYVPSLKTIYCTICLTKEEFEKQDDSKKTGVIKFVGDYGEENDEGIEKVTVPRDLSNLKKKMKIHLESKLHNSKVNELENKDDTKNHDSKVEKEAAMRCARLCYFLYKKGRPFSDYPELVATIVQGSTFMGDINHSIQFPRAFLKSVSSIESRK